MAAFALLDTDIYAGGLDLSCFANQINVAVDVAELDATTFCSSGWSVPIAGKRSVAWEASGPLDMATATAAQTSAVDEIFGGTIGQTYTLSAVPSSGTAYETAYFTQGLLAARTIIEGDAAGLATHSAKWTGSTPMVRGRLEAIQTITASGNSAGAVLSAVSATQRIWAAVHFLTAGGTTPSITVKIQSDDNSGFTSPTDQITFTAATAKGAQFSSALGPITDTFWRALWTVSGTTPSFQTRVLLGIQ